MKTLSCVVVSALLFLAGTAFADGEGDIAADEGATDIAADEGATIYFDHDSSQLDAAARGELDTLAAWMKANPSTQVALVGHADEVGTAGYNWKLGGSRAAQAKEYLVSQGVDPTQVVILSRGEEMAHEGEGKPQVDRRVVFHVTRQPAAPVAKVEYDEPAYTPAPIAAAPPPSDDDDLVTPIGLSMSVGGGVVGMLDANTRDFTNIGGAWEARMIVGTRIPVAFEGAYVGSAQSIDALGLDSSAMLVGNGAEGVIRVNILTSSVQPYLFGGFGWTHYNVDTEGANTSSVAESEDIYTVPLGAGLGFRAGSVLLDVRGTYRPAFDDQMIADTASGEASDMDSWSTTARAGWEF